MGIKLLPHWCLPTSSPSFYDTDSATAIEMVAKLYGKTNELVSDYNEFVDNVNTIITEFNESQSEDYETFKIAIRQEFQNFINVIDLKILKNENHFNDFKNEQNTLFEAFKNEVNEDCAELFEGQNTNIETFKTQVTNAMTKHVNDVDKKLKEQDEQIVSNITNQFYNIEIEREVLPETEIIKGVMGTYVTGLTANMLNGLEKVQILFDGVHYECTITNENGALCLGNKHLYSSSNPDTKEPFYLNIIGTVASCFLKNYNVVHKMMMFVGSAEFKFGNASGGNKGIVGYNIGAWEFFEATGTETQFTPLKNGILVINKNGTSGSYVSLNLWINELGESIPLHTFFDVPANGGGAFSPNYSFEVFKNTPYTITTDIENTLVSLIFIPYLYDGENPTPVEFPEY